MNFNQSDKNITEDENKCHICDIEFDQLELHFLNSHTLEATELPPDENESNKK